MPNKPTPHPHMTDFLKMKHEMDRLWNSISGEKTGKNREEAWELNPSPGMDICLKWETNSFRRHFTEN